MAPPSWTGVVEWMSKTKTCSPRNPKTCWQGAKGVSSPVSQVGKECKDVYSCTRETPEKPQGSPGSPGLVRDSPTKMSNINPGNDHEAIMGRDFFLLIWWGYTNRDGIGSFSDMDGYRVPTICFCPTMEETICGQKRKRPAFRFVFVSRDPRESMGSGSPTFWHNFQIGVQRPTMWCENTKNSKDATAKCSFRQVSNNASSRVANSTYGAQT